MQLPGVPEAARLSRPGRCGCGVAHPPFELRGLCGPCRQCSYWGFPRLPVYQVRHGAVAVELTRLLNREARAARAASSGCACRLCSYWGFPRLSVCQVRPDAVAVELTLLSNSEARAGCAVTGGSRGCPFVKSSPMPRARHRRRASRRLLEERHRCLGTPQSRRLQDLLEWDGRQGTPLGAQETPDFEKAQSDYRISPWVALCAPGGLAQVAPAHVRTLALSVSAGESIEEMR